VGLEAGEREADVAAADEQDSEYDEQVPVAILGCSPTMKCSSSTTRLRPLERAENRGPGVDDGPC
jgi:hypothetical protein